MSLALREPPVFDVEITIHPSSCLECALVGVGGLVCFLSGVFFAQLPMLFGLGGHLYCCDL